MSVSIEKFGEKIILENNRENIYYDIPILKFIPAKEFVNAVLKLPNTEKKELSYIFEKDIELTLKII